MKRLNVLWWGMLVIGLILTWVNKDGVYAYIGVGICYLMVTLMFLRDIFRWVKNKDKINSSYIRFKNKSSINEFIWIMYLYYSFKTSYITREAYLKHIENKDVKINTLKEYLLSYNGIEKAVNYLFILCGVLLILSIVKNFICKQKISSEGILYNDGEFIEFKDIEKISIEDSFIGFSKRITITPQHWFKVVYLDKSKFNEFRNLLSIYYIGEIEEKESK